MPRYTVDVKAFINVEVEAPDEKSAREAADAYVDNLAPTAMETLGYADGQREHNETAIIIDAGGGFDIDGLSEVEEID